MNRTQDTHMIFIYGLASKPAEPVLTECWKKALIENIRVDSKVLNSRFHPGAEVS